MAPDRKCHRQGGRKDRRHAVTLSVPVFETKQIIEGAVDLWQLRLTLDILQHSRDFVQFSRSATSVTAVDS